MWGKHKAVSLSSTLSFLLIGISLVAAAPRCYDTGNFTTNSTYAKNRDLILASLPPNASANGGFFNASVGLNSDQVYALAMCRGDFTPEDCYSCVNSTIYDLMTNCPNQKEAWAVDPCLVHYANHSFFGTLVLDPVEAGYNTGNITSNLTQFDTIWESLVDNVVRKASNGSSSLKYATGEADVTVIQKIHSLMQCTPDLSHQDCDYCLRQTARDFQDCCHGKQGGYVRRPSCYFRWDLYPFYVPNASTTASLSPPPPPATPPPQSVDSQIRKEGGGSSSRLLVIIVVPIVIFLAVLVIIGVAVLPKVIKKKKRNDQNNKTHVYSLQIDFNAVRVATKNFTDANMLGRGGFGPVYKGKLEDGRIVAIKRLSENSGQGIREFKNEVILLAKLQHRNLVKLLGFSIEQKERVLIYEFLPNSSLDNFIFDPVKRLLLNWDKSIIAGTFGYMAPEYAWHGQYSVKSDVYGFGVLVLEIISGHKIISFSNQAGDSLLTYAWRNWNDGTALEFVDPILRDGSRSDIMRFPSRPAFCMNSTMETATMSDSSSLFNQSKREAIQASINEASISELDPR
ncbi:hypothetical protein V6N12_063018 [Hibiscus sabdariffa]|uniref:Uncharacterized protein n=1 Tax=Hibiscus sabdariffa TaxID=183260 RepID=A0ABR2FAL5_9ROSI